MIHTTSVPAPERAPGCDWLKPRRQNAGPKHGAHLQQPKSTSRIPSFPYLSDSAGDGLPFAVQAQLKHIKWAEYTCPFGWPVQGAWQPTVEEGAPTLTSVHRCANVSYTAPPMYSEIRFVLV